MTLNGLFQRKLFYDSIKTPGQASGSGPSGKRHNSLYHKVSRELEKQPGISKSIARLSRYLSILSEDNVM